MTLHSRLLIAEASLNAEPSGSLSGQQKASSALFCNKQLIEGTMHEVCSILKTYVDVSFTNLADDISHLEAWRGIWECDTPHLLLQQDKMLPSSGSQHMGDAAVSTKCRLLP